MVPVYQMQSNNAFKNIFMAWKKKKKLNKTKQKQIKQQNEDCISQVGLLAKYFMFWLIFQLSNSGIIKCPNSYVSRKK